MERLAFPTEEPQRSAADVPSFRPYFGYALLYAVVLENSSNRKSRKLHCSKLNVYISIKVSEVRFWCAAGFLIFELRNCCVNLLKLGAQKSCEKKRCKVWLYSPVRPPPHYNGLHCRSAWDLKNVRRVEMLNWKCKLEIYWPSYNVNGPAPNRTCNVSAAEDPSSARILAMHC